MQALEWIQSNWSLVAMIAGALVAVLSVVNKHTPHASEGKRWWSRMLLVVLDLAALIKRTPAPYAVMSVSAPGRKPERKIFGGGMMALALALSLGLAGCASSTALERCRALEISGAAHEAAKASAALVCASLDGPKRARCEREAARAAAAAAVALAVARAAVGACAVQF